MGCLLGVLKSDLCSFCPCHDYGGCNIRSYLMEIVACWLASPLTLEQLESGNAWVYVQHCGYWWPGAEALTLCNKWPSCLRANTRRPKQMVVIWQMEFSNAFSSMKNEKVLILFKFSLKYIPNNTTEYQSACMGSGNGKDVWCHMASLGYKGLRIAWETWTTTKSISHWLLNTSRYCQLQLMFACFGDLIRKLIYAPLELLMYSALTRHDLCLESSWDMMGLKDK